MKESFAQLEARGWAEDETAAAYAQDFAQAAECCIPAFLKAARIGHATKVLDCCCGHGILAEAAHQAGADVTGADFSPAMLKLARRRVPAVRFVEADAMNLPFDDDSFDAVMIGFGIPHVPDPPAVFRQAQRVLRPGGRFAYSVWRGQSGAMAYVFEAIAKQGAADIALPPGPGAHDYAEADRATDALEKAGFRDITSTEVDSRWKVRDPNAPFEFFKAGTVRGGALLRSQPQDNHDAIRAAVRENVMLNHGDGPDWDIPIPSVVVSATAI